MRITLAGSTDLPELLPLMRDYCDFHQVAPSDRSCWSFAGAPGRPEAGRAAIAGLLSRGCLGDSVIRVERIKARHLTNSCIACRTGPGHWIISTFNLGCLETKMHHATDMFSLYPYVMSASGVSGHQLPGVC
jgi:hypothetical protein